MNGKLCPNCGGHIPNGNTPGAYPGALSRRDNITEICSACGTLEALEDYARSRGSETPETDAKELFAEFNKMR